MAASGHFEKLKYHDITTHSCLTDFGLNLQNDSS